MTNYPPPPAHLEPYVRVLGADGAIDFLLVFGGGEIYLTTTPNHRAQLVQRVGLSRAVALAVAIGQMKVRVPTAKPWIARCLRARGDTVADIARQLHVADVSVRRWLKGANVAPRKAPDPRQMTLF